MRILLRQTALALVRLGLVLLLLSVLLHLVPMPNPADAVADDLAIFTSIAVVAAGAGYLFFTRGVPE